MKYIIRVVLILMSIITAISGCQNPNDKAVNLLTDHLQEKYHEKFTIEAIGGRYGVNPTHTIKFFCSSERFPLKRFKAQVGKNFTYAVDNYVDILVSQNAEQQLTELTANYFTDPIVYVEIDSGWYPKDTDHYNMSLQDYEQFNPDVSIRLFVVVDEGKNDSSSISTASLKAYADGLAASVKDASIKIIYANGLEYATLAQTVKSSSSIDKEIQTLLADSHVRKISLISFVAGELYGIKEEIK